MAKKKKSDEEPKVEGLSTRVEPPAESQYEIEERTERPESSTRDMLSSVSAKLTPDGAFDLAGMRQGTRDKLIRAIQATPGLLPAPPPSVSPDSVTDDAVNALYGVLATIEIAVASRKWAPDLCTQIIPYGPAELEALRPPTKRVLAKHVHKLGAWADEAELGLLLLRMSLAKVQILHQVTAEREAHGSAQAQAT